MSPIGFVRPTFQLPRVCRQVYLEASAYVYTENTFAFHDLASFDRWIKNRCIGQRRFVASLDIPRTYTRLYRSSLRKGFRLKFPNIKRIGIDNWTLFCDYDQTRRQPKAKGRSPVEMWAEAKGKIVQEIRAREDADLIVEWHGRSMRRIVPLSSASLNYCTLETDGTACYCSHIGLCAQVRSPISLACKSFLELVSTIRSLWLETTYSIWWKIVSLVFITIWLPILVGTFGCTMLDSTFR